MSEESIQVYARVRPCADLPNDFSCVKIDELDQHFLRFELPAGLTQGNLTQAASHKFAFEHIFWKDSTQDDIFDIIAIPLLNHAMEGYNATLFAYGQTGSGKTFTITGDGTPTCMGVVPRAINYVYNNLPGDKSNYEISISYLEIYNNTAYDLLTLTNHDSMQKLEDLRKVQIVDTGKETLFKNLSIESAPDIETAHLHFWTGESARQKAATVNNKYSSRSHTIFTFYFKFSTDDNIVTSRINFVDLAGSEKYETLGDEVSKRKLEARHINKSLHTLQSVIVGINNRQSHIPFRDSALTRFLKDSLVGNVRTAMIAALSTNKHHISETLSTCRFAESVAQVSTTARLNQREIPAHEMITKLRSEISHLREEIARASGNYYSAAGPNDGPTKVRKISDIEALELKRQVIQFVGDQTDHLDAYAPEQAQFCFQLLKEMIRRGNSATMTVSRLQEKVDDSKRNLQNLFSLMNARQLSRNNGEPLLTKQSAYLEFCKNHEKFSILQDLRKSLKEGNEMAQAKFEELAELRNTHDELQDKVENATIRLDELENAAEQDDEEIEFAREELQNFENELAAASDAFAQSNEEIRLYKKQIVELNREVKQVQEDIKNEFEKFWVDVVMAHSQKTAMTPKPKRKKQQVPQTVDLHKLKPT
ncbi:Kinesin motor domain containing protein [Tritrichomonas foetus]|uniref:Kinesin-like protein n=1 Tax=Tritrichomonas foetus TaxID=1144522 RepID=A0A1J4JW96_9EUKA|nr:Kinesin motor domain containing protein [Tritrichomonas foetus]|eukprot:OHT02986.1 Kinesin motor domain containing protein [Tritrichomonas foetus]